MSSVSMQTAYGRTIVKPECKTCSCRLSGRCTKPVKSRPIKYLSNSTNAYVAEFHPPPSTYSVPMSTATSSPERSQSLPLVDSPETKDIKPEVPELSDMEGAAETLSMLIERGIILQPEVQVEVVDPVVIAPALAPAPAPIPPPLVPYSPAEAEHKRWLLSQYLGFSLVPQHERERIFNDRSLDLGDMHCTQTVSDAIVAASIWAVDINTMDC